MANFYPSWYLTKQNEGGYSNDPNDTGGETYRGISRKFNPYWTGWELVDTIQPVKQNFTNNVLDLRASNLYNVLYWQGINGDLITNQELANVIFDQAVIGGVGRTNDFIKDILNKRFGTNFVLNGKTNKAVIDKLNSVDANRFLQSFNTYRKKFFLFSAGKLPQYDSLYNFFYKYNKTSEDKKLKNMQFLSGWLKRVKRYEVEHEFNFFDALRSFFERLL